MRKSTSDSSRRGDRSRFTAILASGGFIRDWDFYSQTPTLVNRLIIEAPPGLPSGKRA